MSGPAAHRVGIDSFSRRLLGIARTAFPATQLAGRLRFGVLGGGSLPRLRLILAGILLTLFGFRLGSCLCRFLAVFRHGIHMNFS